MRLSVCVVSVRLLCLVVSFVARTFDVLHSLLYTDFYALRGRGKGTVQL